MNIKEMHALTERLLKEGIDPNTPIVNVYKEVQVCDEGEGRPSETIEFHYLEEIDDAHLVMSEYRPDGSPKMAMMMPQTGPVLMVTSLETSAENIQGFVEYLDIPKLDNLGAIYGRVNRVYAPKEFIIAQPVFNGVPFKEAVVKRDWLITQLRNTIPEDLMPSSTGRRKTCGKPHYGNWVLKATTVAGQAGTFSNYGPGIFTPVDEHGYRLAGHPHWVYLNGASHEYLVNLDSEVVYVMLDGGDTWIEWANDKDIVADSQASLAENIDNFI